MDVLGRDKLGRLIYKDDVIEDGGLLYSVLPDESDGFIKTLGNGYLWWHVPPNSVTVNLNYSPKWDNYHRYFCNLGSVDKIIEAVNELCDGQDCDTCVFRDWGEAFGIEPEKGCSGFNVWLMKRAVI